MWWTMLSGLLDPVHLVILLILVLFVVGPRRLPELGESLGKTVRLIKEAQQSREQDRDRSDGPPTI
ncbi:MAG: twin-arginine translocase TatA/TatE family subunit [Firmicutes bacterium]|nr:twin-arginine translocase TatA/TatE family subunit [Bacillota bacterium]